MSVMEQNVFPNSGSVMVSQIAMMALMKLVVNRLSVKKTLTFSVKTRFSVCHSSGSVMEIETVLTDQMNLDVVT